MHKLSYHPGNSLVHRLYPITKFGWLLIGTGLLFFITDGRLLILTSLFYLAILISINRKVYRMRGFKFAFFTGFGLLVLYLLFDKSGRIIFDPGIKLFSLTTGGLLMGLQFSGRFLSIVFLSYIFIMTTEPSDLAYALMKWGLPYRYGFMLVTALRLSPVLEDEGRTIYQAQLARGVRYDQASPRKLLLIVQQFLTPLLISALRRADKLVFSMEGRGFGKFSKRTFRNRPTPSYFDLIVSLSLLLYFALLLTLNSRSMA